MDDYYTEGWAALRQCALDGQHILNCAADVTVPCATGGPDEQAKAELKQCVSPSCRLVLFFPSLHLLCLSILRTLTRRRVNLDAFARRHEGQKIYLRQSAAQRWIDWRDQILMGGRPHSGNQTQLRAVDQQLRVVSLASISPFYHPLLLSRVPLPWPSRIPCPVAHGDDPQFELSRPLPWIQH
jgi:hypothetical protein